MGVEHLFDAFKQDFDLPSAAVQLQHESHWPALFRQGCDQEMKTRQKKGLLAQLAPFLSCLLLPKLSKGCGLFVGEDDGDQAHGQVLSLGDDHRMTRVSSWSQSSQPLSGINPEFGCVAGGLAGKHGQVPGTETSERKRLSLMHGEKLGSLTVCLIPTRLSRGRIGMCVKLSPMERSLT